MENLTEIKSKSFFNGPHGDSSAPLMLEPTHEIMEKFQNALKQHLMRQKQKLVEEIRELKNDISKTEKEENSIGFRLYSTKQDIKQQQKTIIERQNKIDEIFEEKLKSESELRELKSRVEKERETYDLELQREEEMRIKVEHLHGLEQKVLQWKEEMESDLKVHLRVSEKTEADQKQLMEDNRKLDMYIFRLMTEVQKLESELNLMSTQLDRKEKEKALLTETLADANADLETLTAENKRLLADWNALVVAMGQRDAAYGHVLEELSASEEAFRNLNIEIDSYKKSSMDEIRRSEEFGLMLTRNRNHLENNSRLLKDLLEKKLELEKQVFSTTEFAMQADRDLQIAQAQLSQKELEHQQVQNELEALTRQKHLMEDQRLNLLLEQSTNDKAAINLNRAVKTLREKAREQDMGLMETENRISKLILETENEKADIARNQEILDEMNRDLDAKEAELHRVEMDTKEIQNQITNRQGKLVTLTRKMEELASNAGWDELGLSPVEVQIRDLEWKLQDLKNENENLQQQWMRQQANNVKLTQLRSEQMKEVTLMRKQIILLEQKHLKTKEDLEKEERLQAEIKRNISHLQQRLTTLCGTYSSKSSEKIHVDKDLLLEQTTFVKSLKDSELEQMKVKDEITNLENLLEERAGVMLDVQKEMLAWEKKLRLAMETKQAIQREKSDQGDIGQMKQEIHRMEVRYGQLKKVQEKLLGDLEQTIHRREAIVEEADAREKRERGTNRSRANFQRKIEELKNRLKAIRQEHKAIDKLTMEAEANHEELVKQFNDKSDDVNKLKMDVKRMEGELEEGQLKYQQGVEILVRRQRKCKLLGKIKTGQYRPLYRNELTLENELGVSRNINGDLTSILEALMADFPAQKFVFSKILNTLKPDVI